MFLFQFFSGYEDTKKNSKHTWHIGEGVVDDLPVLGVFEISGFPSQQKHLILDTANQKTKLVAFEQYIVILV